MNWEHFFIVWGGAVAAYFYARVVLGRESFRIGGGE